VLALSANLMHGGSASAQSIRIDTDPSDTGDASIFTMTPTRISAVLDGRLRPILGGVAPGGGPGIGLSYDVTTSERWRTVIIAMVTAHRYWSFQAETVFRGERFEMAGYARAREMSRLSFFGSGMHSGVGDHTTFRMRDPTVGGFATVRVAPYVSLGGRVESMWPSIGPGRAAGLGSIEERFDERTAPGLSARARLDRHQAFVDIDLPATVGESVHQGGRYRVAYATVTDPRFRRFSFRRVDLEGRQQFGGWAPYHRMTLQAWVSASSASEGHDVPFFLQPTLGGKGRLRSLHDGVIGTDGIGMLRSFRSLRFRDRSLLLLQAEYRLPLWGPVDATVFVDAGQVSGRTAELKLADLKRSYGFSVNVMRGPAAAARVDFAFGGGEGRRVLLTLGDFVP
jgi:hypothetical protein